MFIKQRIAKMTAVALLLTSSSLSFAEDFQEKRAREESQKAWQDEASSRRNAEQSRNAEREKTRRDSSADDSSCGVGCVAVTAFALYLTCRALGGCRSDEEAQRAKEQTQSSPPSSPSARSWRVYGDLNMRESPRLNARKAGIIPADTSGIRLGSCVLEEWTWEGATGGSHDRERVWCEAQFGSQTGWVSAKCLFSEQ